MFSLLPICKVLCENCSMAFFFCTKYSLSFVYTGYQVPFDYRVVEIVGLVHHLKCEKDPDYEWLDRIRTPRATNEARQSAMRDALKNAGVSLYLDTEGSSTDLFTVRVLGTALRIEKGKDAGYFLETYTSLLFRQCGTGAIVAVRAVHILEDDDDDPELTRKRWWNDLRAECHQQAVAVDCNLIIGYSEQFTVNDGLYADVFLSIYILHLSTRECSLSESCLHEILAYRLTALKTVCRLFAIQQTIIENWLKEKRNEGHA
uniref:3'-5' exonuclease domain-containing protein n=1 Tax=Angiostrongylus cantonensis TaxID=6313 RepID=A0A0K0D4P0_ANGCA